MVGHWAGKMVATSVVLKAHHSADQWVPMMVVQWGLPTALNSADWTVEKKALCWDVHWVDDWAAQ